MSTDDMNTQNRAELPADGKEALSAVRELVLMGFVPGALGGGGDGPEMMLYMRGSQHYIDVIHVYGHKDGQTTASRTSKGVEALKIVGDIRSIVDTVKQWPTTAIADASDF